MQHRRGSSAALRKALGAAGVASAPMLATRLGISQPTVSRGIAALGDEVLRIGRTRATRYALRRRIEPHGGSWPLHRIDETGHAQTLGHLHALHQGAWYLECEHACPLLRRDEFASGLFPDLPWFLDDMRPQGFLGRAFVHQHAAALDAPTDLMVWHSDHVLAALLRFGDDLAGDLLLGDAALNMALRSGMHGSGAIALADREAAYPERAMAALCGELIGSSAGGEQAKFTALLRDESAGYRAAVVKFSEPAVTPSALRWADLLVCESLAADALRGIGIAAAETDVLDIQGRRFLESTRHDRSPQLGRRGYVSLRALDAAFFGLGRAPWRDMAGALLATGLVDVDTADRIHTIDWFGELIANTDMHFGNLAFHLRDEAPLPVLPVFDMLPMRYAPGSAGAIIERAFDPALPLPRHLTAWRRAVPAALSFWSAVADDARISAGFKRIAATNRGQVEHLLGRFG